MRCIYRGASPHRTDGIMPQLHHVCVVRLHRRRAKSAKQLGICRHFVIHRLSRRETLSFNLIFCSASSQQFICSLLAQQGGFGLYDSLDGSSHTARRALPRWSNRPHQGCPHRPSSAVGGHPSPMRRLRRRPKRTWLRHGLRVAASILPCGGGDGGVEREET